LIETVHEKEAVAPSGLLRNTDYPVADICFRVGLDSVGSFTSSFRRTYGKTPTATGRHSLLPLHTQ